MRMSVRVCFFAMLCVAVTAILKQLRPDMVAFVRIGCTVAICTLALGVVSPMLAYVRSLFTGTSFGEIGSILLKALGVALLAQICADICRDCGENSAASGVELVAKLEILLLCLPMLEKVISTAREVLSW